MTCSEPPNFRSQGTTAEIQRKQQECNGLETQDIKNMIFLTALPCWKIPWLACLAGQFRGTVGPRFLSHHQGKHCIFS